MIPALIAVRTFAARVPAWAWVALGCLLLAGVLYLKGRSDGREACQQAQERAEAKADERAKGVGARAQAKAEDVSEELSKITEDAADEVRREVRYLPRACPDPVLPDVVHDRLGEAVRRAREALPDDAGADP